MNAFGDNRMIGPQGRPGRDAFDIVKWAPGASLRFYREQQEVNFHFKDATEGLIFDGKKPVGLKNHGLFKKNAKYLHFKFISNFSFQSESAKYDLK